MVEPADFGVFAVFWGGAGFLNATVLLFGILVVLALLAKLIQTQKLKRSDRVLVLGTAILILLVWLGKA